MADEAGGAVRTAGEIVLDVWRVVIVRPVRHGTLDAHRHGPGVAGIAWAVAALYGVTVLSILLANPLRSASTLETSVGDGGIIVVPTLLLPAVLCLMGICFGLLLAGSQRAQWWRRLLHLGVVGGALVSVVTVGIAFGGSAALNWTSGALAVAVLGYIVVMWTRRTSASVDAFVLVLLASGTLLAAYRSLVVQGLMAESSGELITASLVLTQVATLALPVAFLSGMSACALGVSLIARGGEQVSGRAAQWVGLGVTAGALAWQWLALFRSVIDGAAEPSMLARERVAALALVGLCALAWWLVRRVQGPEGESHDERPGAEEVAGASVALAVPVSYGVTAAAFLSALLGALIVSLGLVASPDAVAPLQALLAAVGSAAFATAVRVAVVVGLALGAVVLARRGSRLMASVAAVDAVVLGTFYGGGRVLPDWMWTPPAIGDIGMAVATAMAIAWTLQRRWERARAGLVLLLALLSALVRQADFFAVPLGFLIGASATALLIIGLVWGFLVDGGEVHEGSRGFPGDRQLVTFLGTFLFGITVVAWAVIGKNVGTSLVLSGATSLAVTTLGSALMISVILAAAWSIVAGRRRTGSAEPAVAADPAEPLHR